MLRTPRLAPAALVLALTACARDSTTEREPFTPAQYSMEDFYGNKEFFGGSFSADRRNILVGSNLSGIYNAYAIPVAGGEPVPLTSSTGESIFAISYFPADDRILYSSDQGGNELAHLFVRETDGSTRDITPGAKHQANFAGWAYDDRSFFITTNERDPRFFDLYEVAVDGLARTMTYRNTEGFQIGDVSRDRRHLALMKIYTTSDTDIFLHDFTAGTTTNITQHTGTIANSAAAFSPDNTKLLFLSDSGREYSSLRSYDLATKAKAAVTNSRGMWPAPPTPGAGSTSSSA